MGKHAQSTRQLLALPSAAPAATSSTPAVSPPAHAFRKRPTVSYTDGAGHVWSGMGPMPRWLKDSIAAGKSLADFAK